MENVSGVEIGVAFVVWLTWIAINAMIAQAKHLSVPGVILASVVLSPVIAWLYAAGMPPRDAPADPYR